MHICHAVIFHMFNGKDSLENKSGSIFYKNKKMDYYGYKKTVTVITGNKLLERMKKLINENPTSSSNNKTGHR